MTGRRQFSLELELDDFNSPTTPDTERTMQQSRELGGELEGQDTSERDRLLGGDSRDDGFGEEEEVPFEHVTPVERDTFERSKKGYYIYSVGLVVFDQISIILFLPLTLEALAKSRGYLAPDHTMPCLQVQDPSGGVEARAPHARQPRCSVWLLGAWVDTASVSLGISSTAMLFGAFFVIALTRQAGKTQSKKVLSTTTLIGSLAALGFILFPLESKIWWISCLLNIITNVSYSICGVVFGSHLVGLGRTAERIEEEPGLPTKSPTVETVKEVRKASPTSHIASRAFALGYFTGTLATLAMLVLVWSMGATTLSTRLAIGLSGIFWALVGSVGATLLYSTPTSSVSSSSHKMRDDKDEWHWTEGFSTVWSMLKQAPELKDTFVYLITWIMFSDGFSTLGSAAILFGRTTLGLSSSALTLIALIFPVFGVIGALTWRKLQHDYWHCTNLVMLQRILFSASLVPMYGLLGNIIEKYNWSWGGLTASWELFVCAAFFGFVLGGFESYSKTVLSELIPETHASQFFGMFAITSKSSAFIGPLFLSIITTTTGSLRQGFWFIAFMLLTPVIILRLFIDPERGRREADAWGERKMRELERQREL